MDENDLQQKRIDDGDMFYKQMMRNKRNELLKDTDKYFLIDYPINYDQQMIIKQYRQKLRDMPENDFIMPDSPEFIK